VNYFGFKELKAEVGIEEKREIMQNLGRLLK